MTADTISARHRDRVWTIGKIVLALVLVALVLIQIRLEDLVTLLGRMSLVWLLPSLALFQLTLAIMAVRSWVLIERRAPLRDLLALTVIQTLIGNLLATGVGATSFVAALRARHQISMVQGVSTVVLAKLGDLLALGILLALGSVPIWSRLGSMRVLVLGLLAVLGGMVVLGMLVIGLRQPIIALLARAVTMLGLSRFGLVHYAIAMLQSLADESPARIRTLVLPLLGYSFLNAAFGAAFSYCSSRLLGLPLDLSAVLFFNALTQMVAWIPVQVFGGLGTFEITGLYVLRVLVDDTTLIAPYVLSSRVLFYFLNLTLLPLLAVGRGRAVAHADRG